jgi:CBS domain-containing protein
MLASEFMTKNVVSLSPDKTVQDAALLMLEKNISAVPVVDSESRLLGLITEGDFIGEDANVPHALAELKKVFGHIFYHEGVEEIYKDAKNKPLEEVMCQSPKTVSPDFSLNDVIDIMSKYNLRRVPVIENDKLVGMITRRDILRAFAHLS